MVCAIQNSHWQPCCSKQHLLGSFIGICRCYIYWTELSVYKYNMIERWPDQYGKYSQQYAVQTLWWCQVEQCMSNLVPGAFLPFVETEHTMVQNLGHVACHKHKTIPQWPQFFHSSQSMLVCRPTSVWHDMALRARPHILLFSRLRVVTDISANNKWSSHAWAHLAYKTGCPKRQTVCSSLVNRPLGLLDHWMRQWRQTKWYLAHKFGKKK